MCSGLVERRETLVVLSVQFLRACSEVMLNAELKVIAEFLSKIRATFLFPYNQASHKWCTKDQE